MRNTLCISAVLLAFPACATEEIGSPTTCVATGPVLDGSELTIMFAPSADTYEEKQAWEANRQRTVTEYEVLVDGSQLLLFEDTCGSRDPMLIIEGTGFRGPYVPAGWHHFTIAPAGGGPVIFAGDAEIPPESMTRLYLFGHLDALQGRFVSFQAWVPSDTLHVSVTNLVRTGPGIEVVSCTDAASCAPLSPPLALGESFVADFTVVNTSDAMGYALATGGWVGYRQIPTAAFPAPPVQPAHWNPGPPLQRGLIATTNMVVAPIYMSAEGNVTATF